MNIVQENREMTCLLLIRVDQCKQDTAGKGFTKVHVFAWLKKKVLIFFF